MFANNMEQNYIKKTELSVFKYLFFRRKLHFISLYLHENSKLQESIYLWIILLFRHVNTARQHLPQS